MQTLVRDVMTRSVVTANEETSFKELAMRMLDNHVSALPVVDASERVIGVVSEADLLVKEAAVADRSVWGSWWRGRRSVMAPAELARDLMTSPAITISSGDTLAEAARQMYLHRVKRLPVVDETGRLAGIISRIDLLSVFRRSDTHIRDEIISKVVAGEFGINPDDLEVTVRSGIVTVTGEVPGSRVAVGLLRAMRHVEGVVNVRSQFTFPTQKPGAADTALGSAADAAAGRTPE
jgi:CBS domain-containing protein